ncbi:HET-domain-containing protein [Lophium mytilinum]|uniref:HET-domain-containing protein n=1 Tax=Lophium mytilinum TaxID=390894 RepID=A0A6A6R1D8_9PEZI|nr:HET-domain-containing protein [Lophium mytilinum]
MDRFVIIQDSDEDWELEASTMDKVYQNAALNIAASEFNVSGPGLFGQKLSEQDDPFDWRPFWINLRTSRGTQKFICFQDRWKEFEECSPLNSRGWVLQERVLSPRTIHFGSPMFWECRERVSCPVRIRGAYESSKLRPRSSDDVVLKSERKYPVRSDENGEGMRRWNKSIHAYTGCSLTKQSDKLIAISGIARVIHRILDDEYAAGLWKGRLIRGLSWYRTRPPLPRPTPYRGTVSWPSSFTIYAYSGQPRHGHGHRWMARLLPTTSDFFGGGMWSLL